MITISCGGKGGNACASTHCEKGLLIKNPFMTSCHCGRKPRPADGVAGYSHAVSSGGRSVGGTVAEGRGASPVSDEGGGGGGAGQAAGALPSAGDLLGPRLRGKLVNCNAASWPNTDLIDGPQMTGEAAEAEEVLDRRPEPLRPTQAP